MQCSQKVGQKKWSHNSSQKASRTSTPTPPLLKSLLKLEMSALYAPPQAALSVLVIHFAAFRTPQEAPLRGR